MMRSSVHYPHCTIHIIQAILIFFQLRHPLTAVIIQLEEGIHTKKLEDMSDSADDERRSAMEGDRWMD